MMTHDELINDFNSRKDYTADRELELERLKICYTYASGDDRRVIWAVLNKYVPMLSAEGLI